MRAVRLVLKAVAGVALGLLGAEAAFRVRDGGAFPLLNVFAPDPEVGVVLRPGAEERLRTGDRVTAIVIDAQGGRAAPGAPGGEEEAATVIVGDSQVFGLGVEAHETFSARLSASGGVRNAGVPAHGPAEYVVMLERWLAQHHPRTVVLVVDAGTDVLEAMIPAPARLTAHAGWAVSLEGVDGSRLLPGGDLLGRRSHLVFAVRRLWSSRLASAPEASHAQGAEQLRTLLDDRESYAQLDPEGEGPVGVLFGPYLERVRRLCERAHARALVAVLPQDGQVSDAEGTEAPGEPAVMAPTRVLLTDLVAVARRRGLDALDLTPALAAAGPGVFRRGDGHLSARGHEVVAEALAAHLGPR